MAHSPVIKLYKNYANYFIVGVIQEMKYIITQPSTLFIGLMNDTPTCEKQLQTH